MRLDFSAPFSRFFDLLGKNFALFAGLGLVGVILPALAVSYGLFFQTGFGVYDWTENASNLAPDAWFWLAGGSVFIWFLKMINLSMVTEVAILRAVGKKADLGAAISGALRNIIPIILISIVCGLLVMGGLILLIVPGIIWAIATCVAVPAYVGERGIGIMGAINRSFELTRNNRWTLFAVFLVVLVLFFLVAGVFGMIGAVAMLGGGAVGTDPASASVLSIVQIVNIVFEASLEILSNVFVAALYVCLREVPGKQNPSQAASVFE
ncbi:putative membrane protein [Asticcacaulis biprosthecium C19]|uniref:Putative membrane protein n=1 Tax=Asticcacaulis biprosthecium C19 TaxID=715226 RepID=F4QLX9_9CAUL|nr:hypothetical protein [Asticcacaulis biprosthecium]EGF93551.1 putative membrane protein [Asticcacaulis biprosthecium C19]